MYLFFNCWGFCDLNNCYHCTRRTAECHSTCEDYIKFKEEIERVRVIRKKQQLLDTIYHKVGVPNGRK